MSRRCVTQAVVSGALTVCLGGLVLGTLARHVVINTTTSDRLGLYWRHPLAPTRAVRPGERVIFVPPLWVQEELRRVAPQVHAARPWMKRIAAVAGDTVCAEDDHVTINGAWRAARPLRQDYVLTAPQGCETLADGTYFMLNAHPRSFDSRYIGAITRTAIQSTATPLYTWEAQP